MDQHAFLRSLDSQIHRYDFYQLLRILENLNKDKPRLGYAAKPDDDWVRLGQEPTMAFSPSTFSSYKVDKQLGIARLEQLFFGVFGPNGPMPLHLTEYARERIRHFDDESFSRFVDIFHHRLLSFFYRAWADSKAHVSWDRPEEDRFYKRVKSFFGKRIENETERNSAETAMCFFAGRFSQQCRNEEGLLAVIGSFFKVPVALKQFVGSWLEIPEHNRFYLADDIAYGHLGLDSTLGERVWECQSKLSLVFGPLSLDEYKRFLPGSENLHSLSVLMKNYLGEEFDWDLQLVLKDEQTRPARLGEFSRLGWTTWVFEEHIGEDFDQLYVSPQQELAW